MEKKKNENKKIDKKSNFLFNNELLPFAEIAKRDITSVTFLYNSCPKKERVPGIMGFFGKTKIIQEVKEGKIIDPEGIRVKYEPSENVISLYCNRGEEWENIVDFDPKTLNKKLELTIFYPFSISFSLAKLKEIK